MKKRFVVFILVVASLIATQCGGTPSATEAPAATKAPVATEAPATKEAPTALDGKALLEERCTKCHDLGRVEKAKKTEEEWKATVERMMGKGAQLNQTEQELVIKYLAKTYPK